MSIFANAVWSAFNGLLTVRDHLWVLIVGTRQNWRETSEKRKTWCKNCNFISHSFFFVLCKSHVCWIDIKRETERICDANSRLDRVVPYSGYSQSSGGKSTRKKLTFAFYLVECDFFLASDSDGLGGWCELNELENEWVGEVLAIIRQDKSASADPASPASRHVSFCLCFYLRQYQEQAKDHWFIIDTSSIKRVCWVVHQGDDPSHL